MRAIRFLSHGSDKEPRPASKVSFRVNSVSIGDHTTLIDNARVSFRNHKHKLICTVERAAESHHRLRRSRWRFVWNIEALRFDSPRLAQLEPGTTICISGSKAAVFESYDPTTCVVTARHQDSPSQPPLCIPATAVSIPDLVSAQAVCLLAQHASKRPSHSDHNVNLCLTVGPSDLLALCLHVEAMIRQLRNHRILRSCTDSLKVSLDPDWAKSAPEEQEDFLPTRSRVVSLRSVSPHGTPSPTTDLAFQDLEFEPRFTVPTLSTSVSTEAEPRSAQALLATSTSSASEPAIRPLASAISSAASVSCPIEADDLDLDDKVFSTPASPTLAGSCSTGGVGFSKEEDMSATPQEHLLEAALDASVVTLPLVDAIPLMAQIPDATTGMLVCPNVNNPSCVYLIHREKGDTRIQDCRVFAKEQTQTVSRLQQMRGLGARIRQGGLSLRHCAYAATSNAPLRLTALPLGHQTLL